MLKEIDKLIHVNVCVERDYFIHEIIWEFPTYTLS